MWMFDCRLLLILSVLVKRDPTPTLQSVERRSTGVRHYTFVVITFWILTTNSIKSLERETVWSKTVDLTSEYSSLSELTRTLENGSFTESRSPVETRGLQSRG